MHVQFIKMVQYERISVSEGIDINRKNAPKECMLYHYWHFKDVGFKFEPHVCNKCHDDDCLWIKKHRNIEHKWY